MVFISQQLIRADSDSVKELKCRASHITLIEHLELYFLSWSICQQISHTNSYNFNLNWYFKVK